MNDLVKSIRLIGLQSAPTVVDRDGRYMLVSGRHRIEAMRVIGRDPIPVRIVDFNDVEARLWTISENLHRNELNAIERAEQITEFAKLSEEMRQATPPAVETQPAPIEAAKVAHPGKRYEQRGNSLAARDLGLSRDEVRRARAIAALPDDTKAKAADPGLDRNQSALLRAAKAPTPQAQISTLEQRAVRTVAPLAPRSSYLRNLENIAAGEFARWVKQTTPNDRTHVIRVLRECAAILEDELAAAKAA